MKQTGMPRPTENQTGCRLLGMDPANLFRPRSLVQIRPECAEDARVPEAEQRQDRLGRQLAQELADRIAILEGELARERRSLSELTSKEVQLRESVMQIRQKIQAMRREIDTVKVTESVQKAQAAIVSHGAGAVSTLSNAAASLQRLKEKQAGRAAEFEAANKLEQIQSGSDLDRRLADAGLLEGPGSGASILARVKARATPALPAPPANVSPQLTIAAPDPANRTGAQR